jgi:hypothetical protein
VIRTTSSVVLADRAHRELWPERHTELAHDDHIEWRIQ